MTRSSIVFAALLWATVGLCAESARAHSIVGNVVAANSILVQFAAAAEPEANASGSAEQGGIAVQFTYSGSFNAVPANAEYRVYAPNDAEHAFQSGRADRLGRVVFQPDRAGAWRIELRTHEGHTASADIDINEDLAVPPAPRWGWWLLFASLIANIALFVYFRRSNSGAPAPSP